MAARGDNPSVSSRSHPTRCCLLAGITSDGAMHGKGVASWLQADSACSGRPCFPVGYGKGGRRSEWHTVPGFNHGQWPGHMQHMQVKWDV